jgi:hypothetical protein
MNIPSPPTKYRDDRVLLYLRVRMEANIPLIPKKFECGCLRTSSSFDRSKLDYLPIGIAASDLFLLPSDRYSREIGTPNFTNIRTSL